VLCWRRLTDLAHLRLCQRAQDVESLFGERCNASVRARCCRVSCSSSSPPPFVAESSAIGAIVNPTITKPMPKSDPSHLFRGFRRPRVCLENLNPASSANLLAQSQARGKKPSRRGSTDLSWALLR
jgi:hypothetical protein